MNILETFRKIELAWNDYTSSWLTLQYLLQCIYDDLNKEYFNNKLSIKVEEKYIIINDNEYDVIDSLYYLERIYELENIKKKIERIYENN